ncbi:hypothetical protein AVEN_119213-1 [Araneus ventricosus]|uniref:J domain-containing protein n=1 Tax=Araneus ventricosus TaxID=182803 RepID=A0A4Y2NXB8_ARAVE|nr:hypothetical protein AVEN_119213-1 [Araneus ventricosus]
MDYTGAVAALSKLLGCNVENMLLLKSRKLVKKRFLSWHPDKNPDKPEKFKEGFLELQEAWKVCNNKDDDQSQTSSGFHEDNDNEYVWSDPSDDEDESNSIPFSD